LWRYLLALVKKNWKGFPFHIGTVLDYILFKEIEVKSLICITEAKRLNFSREKMVDYLINAYAQEAEC
jgi:vacuolar-type H+-ATPase subunit C/Vma6